MLAIGRQGWAELLKEMRRHAVSSKVTRAVCPKNCGREMQCSPRCVQVPSRTVRRANRHRDCAMVIKQHGRKRTDLCGVAGSRRIV